MSSWRTLARSANGRFGSPAEARARRNRVFWELVKAAAEGRRCPSNTELLPVSGYKAQCSISGAFEMLAREGLIRILDTQWRRQIEIVATGDRTATWQPRRRTEFKPRRPVREIVPLAAEIFRVPALDIYSRKRPQRITAARHAVYAIASEQGWPLTHIGRVLDRDHSTIGHGVRTIPARLSDAAFASRYQRLRQLAAPVARGELNPSEPGFSARPDGVTGMPTFAARSA